MPLIVIVNLYQMSKIYIILRYLKCITIYYTIYSIKIENRLILQAFNNDNEQFNLCAIIIKFNNMFIFVLS